jgi:RNA polymerase subunit RPABC4/transcription elongation factor Spt4
MVCKNCGFVNPEYAKFCAKCGQPSFVAKSRDNAIRNVTEPLATADEDGFSQDGGANTEDKPTKARSPKRISKRSSVAGLTVLAILIVAFFANGSEISWLMRLNSASNGVSWTWHAFDKTLSVHAAKSKAWFSADIDVEPCNIYIFESKPSAKTVFTDLNRTHHNEVEANIWTLGDSGLTAVTTGASIGSNCRDVFMNTFLEG